ncbi:hypothetical protein QWY75_09095 [Pontixanthobacter aestiaquae]|uniref:Uncharacterized protein n=1 Tax=Pontixanthobacter aestiaquae TaxID=1509367 RepID=A0A844Z403_9SPHN|nr:hypothetical protein [Pontixanthobacter aestiaquae]MDN3646355.1 hypothetical protein [Pontixanthobacter aestiaquae]MXO82655.1 hypothetical protein [Pontixanthobacter aestiaquae]
MTDIQPYHWLRSGAALSVLLITSLAPITGTANARNLNAQDIYDARIIAAHNCNNTAKAAEYSEAAIDRCAAIYQATLKIERDAADATPQQRNTLAIARGLSMLTVGAGYAKLDGKMTARACRAVAALQQALALYTAGASPGLEGLYSLLTNTRDVSVPKCRQGGHM